MGDFQDCLFPILVSEFSRFNNHEINKGDNLIFQVRHSISFLSLSPTGKVAFFCSGGQIKVSKI